MGKMSEFKTNPFLKKHLKPAIFNELKSAFEKCHNYIYANEGLLKEKVFSEILKLLFIKMFDEKSNDPHCNFHISNKELEKLKENKQNQFVQRIFNLFENVKSQFSDIFQNQYEEINLKPLTLGFIVHQLQDYTFINTPVDVKGTAFQSFIYAHQRGERGEFFTPHPIIDFIVKIIDPNYNEKVIDPACGSGGFLVEALKWIKEKYIQAKLENRNHINEHPLNDLDVFLCGIEINPDLTNVSKMQMILNNANNKHIFTANSLLSPDQLMFIAERLGIFLEPTLESFDILMTNPPFGTKGKITDQKILEGFDLGHKWHKKGDNWDKNDELLLGQAPEILFIERCLQFLKDGGRMAIVLPAGILENPSQEYIRKFIKSKAKILAIIQLPSETFIPYGTGISVSILFLQKLSPQEIEQEITNNYDIFFAFVEKIGYEGTKIGKIIYKRNEKGEIIKDNKGNSIIDEDLMEISREYINFKIGKELPMSNQIFSRKYNEIRGRFDPKFYQPIYLELRDELIKAGAVPLEKVVRIISKKAEVLNDPEATIKYIEISDVNPITSEVVSYNEMKVYEAPSRASYEVIEGDVITAIAGVSTGTKKHASAYISNEFDGCICTNGFRVLKPKNKEIKIDPYYLLYYIRSKEFLMQMYRYRTGTTIPAVSDADLKKILIIIPQNKIQDEIVKKVKESYNLRKKSLKMINKLGEEIRNKLYNSS